MTSFTPEEQYYLEQMNRARLDPNGEAQRDGISLNQFIPGGTLTGDPKQPLAGNNNLAADARAHAEVVRTSGAWKNGDPHDGAGDGSVEARLIASGYHWKEAPRWGDGENIAVTPLGGSSTALADSNEKALFRDDPANMHGSPGGHRKNILNDEFKEVGVGIANGKSAGGDYSIVSQDFAYSGSKSYLSGAVYNDKDGDHFYGIGEQVAGVTVSVKATGGAAVGSDTTGSGGGWTVGEAGGTFDVTFSGGGISPVTATVDAGSRNAKVDLVNGTEIDTSANTTLGAGAVDLRLLGVGSINGTGNGSANRIYGNGGSNVLQGNGGNDVIDGGSGDDTAVFTGSHTQYQAKKLADGSVQIIDTQGSARDGTDTVKNVEHFRFADGTFDVSQIPVAADPPPPPPPPPPTGPIDGTKHWGGSDIGGAGVDTLTFAASGHGVKVDLAAGGAQDLTTLQTAKVAAITHVIGSGFNDKLTGSSAAEILEGGAGKDVLDGNGGKDTLLGGAGDDTLFYHNGVKVDGGTGTDTLVADASTAKTGMSFTVLGSNIEIVTGNSGNDTVDARGVARGITFTGGAGDDVFIGSKGADVFHGGSGSDTFVESGARSNYTIKGDGTNWTITDRTTGVVDTVDNLQKIRFSDQTIDTTTLNRTIVRDHASGTLKGASGNDTLTASNGTYTLVGNAGNDTFDFTGTGSATFTGGSGKDTFDYHTGAGKVTVTDFQPGVDKIMLWDHHNHGTVPLSSLTIADSSAGAVISFHGGSQMVLQGVHVAQLHQSDFIM